MLKLRAQRPDPLTLYIRCGTCGQRIAHSPHSDTLTCACLPQPPVISTADRHYAAPTLQQRRAAQLCPAHL